MMELDLCRGPNGLNPELEALRAKALQETGSDSNDWITRMINRTSHIHAGFLFEDRKTLQNLCLFIGETQNKITDAGWEAFGHHLGLSPCVLKVINHNNFNKEDPCYNTLLAYVQNEKASIGKIIEALFVMGRIDVLSRIEDSINDLADIILQYQYNSNLSNNLAEDTSDYESLPACEEYSSNHNSVSSRYSFIKPKVIPPAPFIFQNIQVNPEMTSQLIHQALNNVFSSKSFSSIGKEKYNNSHEVSYKITGIDNFMKDHEAQVITSLQNCNFAKYRKKNIKSTKTQRYGIKIMLTFAEDGEKLAKEVCKVFRKKRDNLPAIGVLVLSEHIENVNKDPQQFIAGAFSQVDYVCPIITDGYYNLIMKKQKPKSLSSIHIDASFVPYIYRLMNSYFVSNDCLNDKVRCIIPDIGFPSSTFSFILTNPIFGAWVKLNEVDQLAERLLKSNMKKSFDSDFL